MAFISIELILLICLAAELQARATFRIHRDFLKGYIRSPKGANEQSIMASGPFDREAKREELETLKPEMMISLSDKDLYMTKVSYLQPQIRLTRSF